jgi:hypothetical protein
VERKFLRESDLGDFIVECWSFLRIRKKLWLAPLMMTIAVVSPLLRAPQGTRHRAIQKLRRESRKAKRKLEAQRKIVIAEAVIAEARNDPTFAAYIDAIVRKRVTRPFDLTVVTEWVSTT